MATKTRADLVNQALSNLGVLASGQTASAEDYDAVDAHVDQLFASLEARSIVVADSSAIPVEWFGALTTLLADDAASEFGLPGVPVVAGRPDPVSAAESALREMTYGRPTGETMRSEYY